MTQKRYHIIFFLAAAVALGGCKKYLQIQPQGQLTGAQVFSTESGIQQALNGLYTDMANDNLYGSTLTTTTIELMGQQYNVTATTSDNTFAMFQTYEYTQANAMTVFNSIWTQAYSTILSANEFIQAMDQVSGVISPAEAQQLKGEAIAIRAYLHFDMLRLFGPVFATAASSPAIPYYTVPNGATQPILTGTQALDSVLADLTLAENLLADDPVITGGINFGSDFYNSFRNQRLNYYAVKGLMARAYLYGGNTAAAHDSAAAVIAQASQWFPWQSYAAVTDPNNPDRVFSPEILFGVYNANMYTDYTAYFSPNLLTVNILTAQPNRLTATFENNENDYRYTTTWLNGPNGYRTFFKYADMETATEPWRFFQPLLRKSEMYYIAAETETTQAQAFNDLDSVRYYRGLPALASTAVLATEIQKEYQKEFYGEGQLFFFYKRKNVAAINNATEYSPYFSYTITPTYVVPLPLSETTPR